MVLEFYNFGQEGKPDKAVGITDRNLLENGPESGFGLSVFQLEDTSKSNEFGRDVDPNEKMQPLFGIWFYREESVDVVLDNLIKIKDMFRMEKEIKNEQP